MNNYEYITVSNDGVINGGQSGTQENTNAEVQQTDSTGTGTGTTGGGSFWGLMAIYAVFIIGMYYFISRPQKKKQKKIEEMQSQLSVNDDVYTSSGFHGKIVDVEDKTFIVEFGTNKGIRIPVNKSEVYRVVKETALDEKK